MNFIEAIKAMKEGKKVRRSCWEKNRFIRTLQIDYKPTIVWDDGRNPNFRIDQVEATDWEIFEEKKTLSDKIDEQAYKCENKLLVEDVKQSLKEFIDSLMGLGQSKNRDIATKAKEIFGDKLI